MSKQFLFCRCQPSHWASILFGSYYHGAGDTPSYSASWARGKSFFYELIFSEDHLTPKTIYTYYDSRSRLFISIRTGWHCKWIWHDDGILSTQIINWLVCRWNDAYLNYPGVHREHLGRQRYDHRCLETCAKWAVINNIKTDCGRCFWCTDITKLPRHSRSRDGRKHVCSHAGNRGRWLVRDWSWPQGPFGATNYFKSMRMLGNNVGQQGFSRSPCSSIYNYQNLN